MPEAVKMKRPLSVWLAQILLALTLVFTLLVVFEAIRRTAIGDQDGSFDVTSILLLLTYFGLGILAVIALVRRKPVGKWAAVLVFVSTAILFTYAGIISVSRIGGFRNPSILGIGISVGMFLVFVVPFLVISAWLIFSRKVKMFFDPSLRLQVDESSTIFNEPPPPPRFDE